ncbi:LacI family DNA-binding transcriptional regulator [Falsirhodobacter sp. 20TX0035]|uniref:LacI family DNA-binding transcriptional regulator n=1 Tax=Falsirhodobacter sp. 20TX0035 TaxID=3022019 RepID=UPI00232D1CF5|nr:LacI family DNA-binding transcriptional regulator [Falsirhodobacter sp. 20TX0035]MDB6452733.1 LacI family DNA-binding transcriptional regulator [Falsirhodobacter sp. 20TX0035]
MPGRPTLEDLAAAAGVSLSTLDRIVNRRGTVKRTTIEHVLTAAERIGYHGAPVIRQRLMQGMPVQTFGFLLNPHDRALYAELAERLAQRTRDSQRVQGRAVVHYLQDLDPVAMAAALEALGDGCDAIGAVLLDHPLVHAAVERLAAKGIPVWTLFSDLSTPARAGFVGSDALKMGRSAGWFVHQLSPAEGQVLVLTGSPGYLAHGGYDRGLRAALEEASSRLDILPAQASFERDDKAQAIVRTSLAKHDNIVALVVAGGGVEGAVDALTPDQRQRITIIATELSDAINRCLKEGVLDVVLSHPVDRVVEELVSAMEEAALHGLGERSAPSVIPIEIRICESF